MCTVAVVAVPQAGYIVAHNRDERRTRSRGLPPDDGGVTDHGLLCPRDPDGGGTWAGVNRRGLSFCMLNAPDPAQERLPSNPISRGSIPLSLAEAGSPDQVRRLMERIDTARYRPFHLVTVAPGPVDPEILELRWDGTGTTWTVYSAPVLFVSSSLHQISADQARWAVWSRFIAADPHPDRDALSAFMANHEPDRSSLSTCMHRDDAATVSRTLVEVGAGRIVMTYTDGSPCDPGSPVSVRELALIDSPR